MLRIIPLSEYDVQREHIEICVAALRKLSERRITLSRPIRPIRPIPRRRNRVGRSRVCETPLSSAANAPSSCRRRNQRLQPAFPGFPVKLLPPRRRSFVPYVLFDLSRPVAPAMPPTSHNPPFRACRGIPPFLHSQHGEESNRSHMIALRVSSFFIVARTKPTAAEPTLFRRLPRLR